MDLQWCHGQCLLKPVRRRDLLHPRESLGLDCVSKLKILDWKNIYDNAQPVASSTASGHNFQVTSSVQRLIGNTFSVMVLLDWYWLHLKFYFADSVDFLSVEFIRCFVLVHTFLERSCWLNMVTVQLHSLQSISSNQNEAHRNSGISYLNTYQRTRHGYSNFPIFWFRCVPI